MTTRISSPGGHKAFSILRVSLVVLLAAFFLTSVFQNHRQADMAKLSPDCLVLLGRALEAADLPERYGNAGVVRDMLKSRSTEITCADGVLHVKASDLMLQAVGNEARLVEIRYDDSGN